MQHNDIGEIRAAGHHILKGVVQDWCINMKSGQMDSCWYVEVQYPIHLYPEAFQVAEDCWIQSDCYMYRPWSNKAQLLYAACTGNTPGELQHCLTTPITRDSGADTRCLLVSQAFPVEYYEIAEVMHEEVMHPCMT